MEIYRISSQSCHLSLPLFRYYAYLIRSNDNSLGGACINIQDDINKRRIEPGFPSTKCLSLDYLVGRLRDLEDVEELDRPKVWEIIEATRLDIMTLKLMLHGRGKYFGIERERAMFEGSIIRYVGDAIQQRGWRFYIAHDGYNDAMLAAGVWDERNEQVDEHYTANSEAEALLMAYVAALEAEMADKIIMKSQVDQSIRYMDIQSLD